MMRNSITRTIFTSDIHAFQLVMKDGKPVPEALPVLTIPGKASVRDAEKALRKRYGRTAAFTISQIEVYENVYEISVEDFIKYATKTESKPINF